MREGEAGRSAQEQWSEGSDVGWQPLRNLNGISDRGLIERVQAQQEESFRRLGIRSVADAEFRWRVGWRRHFNRLFYSRWETFSTVLLAAERSLEFYDGVDFALAEAWTGMDRRAALAQSEDDYWQLFKEAHDSGWLAQTGPQTIMLNELGRRVDFHALRHTFATLLQLWGLSPRAIMELMRRSDMRLATTTYVDLTLMPLFDEMDKLPSPLASPKSDKTGQNVGKPVQAELELPSRKLVDFRAETEPLANPVPSWDSGKMAEREGFEPSGPSTQGVDGYEPSIVWELLPSPIASPRAGILSPELRQLVRNWAELDETTRLTILGLARPARGDGS